MNLRLVAAGTRMPDWVEQGYYDYAKRLSHDYKLELVEIQLGQRSNGDSLRAIEKEGERMLDSIADMKNPYIVALQVTGKSLTTDQLASFLQQRAQDGRHLVFCIGGPDGIASAVDAKAELRWSLSSLTLPHALVRVIVAEALYRAVSVIKHHHTT